MKKFLGITMLILLSPLLLLLFALTLVGEGSFKLYNVIYFPIYNFAGKPFDTKN